MYLGTSQGRLLLYPGGARTRNGQKDLRSSKMECSSNRKGRSPKELVLSETQGLPNLFLPPPPTRDPIRVRLSLGSSPHFTSLCSACSSASLLPSMPSLLGSSMPCKHHPWTFLKECVFHNLFCRGPIKTKSEAREAWADRDGSLPHPSASRSCRSGIVSNHPWKTSALPLLWEGHPEKMEKNHLLSGKDVTFLSAADTGDWYGIHKKRAQPVTATI